MDADDEQLIDLVQQYCHIWQKTHKLFKDKNAKRNAWKGISVIMNKSAEECEQRWTVLRNKFATIMRTRKRSTFSGMDPLAEPSQFVKRMMFLEGSIHQRKVGTNIACNISVDNIEDTDNAMDIHEDAENTQDVQSVVETNPWDSVSLCLVTSADISQSGSSTSSKSSTTLPHKTKTEKLRTEAYAQKKKSAFDVELSKNLLDSLKTFSTYLEGKKSTATAITEVDQSFGMMVALHLGEMDEDEKKEKKKRILQILFE